MAFEIPSARIRELQNDLRRESGFAAYDPADPSLPSLPSVADALAALDPADLPSSLRCGSCGSGGGLLQGPQSTLCVYCGADRGTEGFSHSISFYSTAACRKLLDYLGLDGSEAVLLETEPSSSIKGQSSAAPKDELALSDLLDLKLRWPLDKEEVNDDGTNKVPSDSMYNLNMNGLDIGTFFSGIDKEISSTLSSKPNGQLTIDESSTRAVNNASPSSENFAVFEKLQSMEPGIDTINVDGRQFGDSFAAWEAEFQPDRYKNLVTDPKTHDHFHDFSDSKFVQTSDSGIGFRHLEKKEQEISTEGNDGGLLKESSAPSSINNWVPDEFWSVKPAEKHSTDQLISETNTTNEFGNPMSANSNNDLFSEWQGFAISSGAQENLVAQGVQTESTLFRHPQETKDTELGTATNKTELDFDEFVDANNDSYDDWKDFTSSNEIQEKPLNLVGKSEVISSEHPLETKSDNLLPISGKKNFHDSSLHLDSNENSFDDWQDFTSSSKGQEMLQALPAQSEVTFSVHPLETKLDNLLPTSGKIDFRDSLHLDSNDDSFDDWQDFTSFSKGQEILQDLGAQSEARFSEHPLETKYVAVLPSNKMESDTSVDINSNDGIFDSWQGSTNSSKTRENMLRSEAQSINTFLDYSSATKMVDISSSGSKDVDNNESFDYNDDSFNNWQGFTSTSGHNLLNDSTLSGHPLEKKSVEPWPSEPANGHDESLGNWLDFTSSSEARQSLPNSGQQTDAELVAQSSETKLAFSKDVGFGNLDLLFHTSGIQNYRDDTRINSLASNGVNSVTHTDSAERSSNIFEISTTEAYEESDKSKIEALISQIPDISFMLADELSVPVKLDMSDLKS